MRSRTVLLALALVTGCGSTTVHRDGQSIPPQIDWVRVFRSPGSCNTWTPLAVDADGRSTLASGSAGDVLDGDGRKDALFVAAYGPDGAPGGSFTAPRGPETEAFAVRATGHGTTLVQGRFHDGPITDANEFDTTGYVSEYDADGKLLAETRLGVGNPDGAIVLGADGVPLLTVSVSEPVTFGSTTVTPITDSGVILRWDVEHEPVWVRPVAAQHHLVMSMTAAPGGDVIVAGIFNGHIEAGGATGEVTDFGSYLAWLSADGTVRRLSTDELPYRWVEIAATEDGDVIAARTAAIDGSKPIEIARFGDDMTDRWARYARTPRIAVRRGRLAIVGELTGDPMPGGRGGDLRTGIQDGRPLMVTLASVADGSTQGHVELPGTADALVVSQMQWADDRSLVLFGEMKSAVDFGGTTGTLAPVDESDCFLMRLSGL